MFFHNFPVVVAYLIINISFYTKMPLLVLFVRDNIVLFRRSYGQQKSASLKTLKSKSVIFQRYWKQSAGVLYWRPKT